MTHKEFRKAVMLFTACILFGILLGMRANADVLYQFGCEGNNIGLANFSVSSSISCSNDITINGSYVMKLPAAMGSSAKLWNWTAPTNYNISFYVATDSNSAPASSSGGIAAEWGGVDSTWGAGGGNGVCVSSPHAAWTSCYNYPNTGINYLNGIPTYVRYEIKGSSIYIFVNGTQIDTASAGAPARLNFKTSETDVNLYFDNLCVYTGDGTDCFSNNNTAPKIVSASLLINVTDNMTMETYVNSTDNSGNLEFRYLFFRDGQNYFNYSANETSGITTNYNLTTNGIEGIYYFNISTYDGELFSNSTLSNSVIITFPRTINSVTIVADISITMLVIFVVLLLLAFATYSSMPFVMVASGLFNVVYAITLFPVSVVLGLVIIIPFGIGMFVLGVIALIQ